MPLGKRGHSVQRKADRPRRRRRPDANVCRVARATRVFQANIRIAKLNLFGVDPKVRELRTLVIYTARRTICEPWDQRQKDEISPQVRPQWAGRHASWQKPGLATGLTFMAGSNILCRTRRRVRITRKIRIMTATPGYRKRIVPLRIKL